jgi:hypothetical protein
MTPLGFNEQQVIDDEERGDTKFRTRDAGGV